MGYKVSEWAAGWLEAEAPKHPDVKWLAKLVLMVLAERANNTTFETWSGDWLKDRVHANHRSVHRSLHQLDDAGAIRLEHRPGRAFRVLFPLDQTFHNPAPAGTGPAPGDPAPTSPQLRAVERAAPSRQARRTSIYQSDVPATAEQEEPGSYSPRCAASCDVCNGESWVGLPEDPSGKAKQPCPRRAA